MARNPDALSAALLAAFAVSAAAPCNTQESSVPKPELLVVSPAKGTTWYIGGRAAIKWSNAKKGTTINIKLSNADRVYTVTDSVAVEYGYNAQTCNDKCNCGAYFWTVPADILPGKYQVVVTSNQDDSVVRYTHPFFIETPAPRHV